MKRFFDFTFACAGLLILSPVLFIVSLVVKSTSSGPVFFLQGRVGKDEKRFILIKFRTMVNDDENKGTGHITIAGDPRITLIGKFLRKWKLDEIPTLLNVLKGDMSFVGPRPDVPGYADKLEGDSRRILGMRPGITGSATLKYSDEEKLLADVDNPKKYNDEVIFPDKVKINLEYMDNRSLWMDIKIIFKTIFRKNY
jgi:lipopolysaccharide/colanic/teichoic acid biosynthesis glycosyltransferase